MSESIIITGGAGNLGRAVADKLDAEGYQLYATLGPRDSADVFAGKNVKAEPVDLLKEDQVTRYVDDVFKEAGSVSAAILLAGGFNMGDIAQTGGDDLDKMISLNFKTAYFTARPILKHFRERGGGRFILVGARPALDAGAGKALVAYTLSKTLVLKLAELINAEGKADGITAHVIVPSIIDTPPNREAMADADFSKWVPPARIADTIAFMLGEAGRMWRETIVRIYNES